MRRKHEADLIVVGAGPAGLAATAAAISRGRKVILIDRNQRPGGQIWRQGLESFLPQQADRLIRRITGDQLTWLPEARVVDAPDTGQLLVEQQEEGVLCTAPAVILATGARELLLPFPGWTIPGVMGIGALQALVKGGLKVSQAKVILAGTGPLLLPVAASLTRAGARLALVAEQAPGSDLLRFALSMLTDPLRLFEALVHRLHFAGSSYRSGVWVSRAIGAERLSEVELTDGRKTWIEPCEWLGSSAGLIPNTELAQLLGCRLIHGAIAVDGGQRTSIAGVWAAGECVGVKGEHAALIEGEIAGAAAAGDSSVAARLQGPRRSGRYLGSRMVHIFAPRQELLSRCDPDTIVCRCEDVPFGALDPAWTQRQAKLRTRIGMGACQGRTCGPACTALFGWEENRVRAPLENPTLSAWVS